jgi:hypothetical protein
MMLESAENFVVTMTEHDGAKSEAHDEQREGLQAVEVAHVIPPKERRILQQRNLGGKRAASQVLRKKAVELRSIRPFGTQRR